MLHFLGFKRGWVLSLEVERLGPKIHEYASVIYNPGCPLFHCWGFIDGILYDVVRYITTQRDYPFRLLDSELYSCHGASLYGVRAGRKTYARMPPAIGCTAARNDCAG